MEVLVLKVESMGFCGIFLLFMEEVRLTTWDGAKTL